MRWLLLALHNEKGDVPTVTNYHSLQDGIPHSGFILRGKIFCPLSSKQIFELDGWCDTPQTAIMRFADRKRFTKFSPEKETCYMV